MPSPASYSPKDPTPVQVHAMTIPNDATGTGRGLMVESVPLGTGSATGEFLAWKNLTGKRVAATVQVNIITEGTGGTFNVGLGSSGTGTGQQFIATGTIGVAGVYTTPGGNASVSSTAWHILSGSGSPDSIVGKGEGINSTLDGYATVFYYCIDA